NLGSEQSPLHMLLTVKELRELGFAPYYFQLHVTIDTAASGHARKALRALYDNLPQIGGLAAFLERVRNGYRLNEVGLSTTQVIDGFDLEEELLAMFERKRPYAAGMHSDRCRIGMAPDPALFLQAGEKRREPPGRRQPLIPRAPADP
ncbi:iron-containing redox enzyme family protein, partial [Pseudomonas aeruginosa]